MNRALVNLAAVLLCLAALLVAQAIDGSPVWCHPRATDTEQPCPQANQCCAVWGICGTGTHYCKKGHCARGACLSSPIIPASNGQGPKPSPAGDQTSCGAVLEGIDLFGADVNNGTPGKSIQDCCATCSALDACGAFTFDPLSGTCYLKSASGWDRKAGAGLKSVIIGKEAGQTAKPSPEQPKPSPEQPKPSSAAGQSSCGVVLQDIDLNGGDIASSVQASSLEGCCASCRAQNSCGAFTFVPQASLCYLKDKQGWNRQGKPGSGMMSVIVNKTATTPSTEPPAVKPPTTTSGGGKPGGYTYVTMTQDQMRRMYQLTSIFENADTTLQYGYAERLYDDRGVTYGFCGFTTGTGDGLMVVEKYTNLKPNNPLAKYLPALRSVAGKGDKFNGLDGIEKEISKLAKDEDFIKAQWEVCDSEYHEPAMEICRSIRCAHAITKAQLHDALVNHGQGLGDKFSVDYILAAAKKAVGGTPASGVDEVAWLQAFLKARHTMLYNWDKVARASVKRITMYEKLVDLGNLNLDGPIYIDLQQCKDANGQTVWQIKDVYYGTFLIYDNPQDDHKLALIV